MKNLVIRKATNIIMAVVTVVSLIFVIYGLKTNLFSSQLELEAFLNIFGIWAPIIFILFQGIQVVFPILPGGIGLLGGVLIFGPLTGFLYNYIGICLGSIAAFLLAKHYGTPIIESLFSPKLKEKYMKWADNKKFSKLFTLAIFMPVAPDDFLCYLAGTTNMSFGRFTTIILLGKPMAIAAYSFGLNVALQHLTVLAH
ncbi:VTT domain-containing protein [Clostridium bowmanii]|uniref:TVP38/TMEM64 family protein n=1 Tax=Clostridium bowmanii TaxID=132925 RepID=UPI001C0ADF30|nr:VTT domain-containing protein [Clostridium bowmanii]MBU3190775.1 VTT domain-containing protein [Clostridium bowmanii]MCA1074979.1 VTT domain-containing protein [Clostridium bowmanii]